MSLLATFVMNHLIPELEAAFVAHEPDMQAALLAEVQAFAGKLGEWVEGKLPCEPVGLPPK